MAWKYVPGYELSRWHGLNEGDLGNEGSGSGFYLDLITHDLKNLNQGVFGYLELMEMLPETTDLQKRFLEEALSYVRMSSNLIRTMEVVEGNDAPSVPQGLYKVMVESYQSFSNVNRNAKIELDTSGITKGLKVNGSRLVVDMFIFLLDFMFRRARGGKLNVHAQTEPPMDGKVQLVLSGDFVPLSEKEHEGLFENGSGDKGTKKGKLVLCGRISKMFGGRIDYEPPVQGSRWTGGRFRITLLEVSQ